MAGYDRVEISLPACPLLSGAIHLGFPDDSRNGLNDSNFWIALEASKVEGMIVCTWHETDLSVSPDDVGSWGKSGLPG
jgi:hypothetical protein